MRDSLAWTFLVLVFAAPAAADKELLWGDTHLHTSNSFDAYLNTNTTTDPDSAYRFAKGDPVVFPVTGVRVQLGTPLDFLVVADHGEYFGVIRHVVDRGIPRDDLGLIDRAMAWATEYYLRGVMEDGTGSAAFASILPETTTPEEAAKNPPSMPIPGVEAMSTNMWGEAIAIADRHNQPGTFTTLIGWEWSSIPSGANLHRVVMTSADAETAGQFLPFSSADSMYPSDLWQWLDETSTATGARFTAIPHNSNISKGYMFPEQNDLRGEPIDEEWVKARARWERVVEATQFKGDSETHPALSPDDPFADFEEYPFYIQVDPPPYDPKPADFVRGGLRIGLAIEERIGFNPYRFGLIGATDSHTGVSTAEEPNFWGKFPSVSTPAQKQVSDPSRKRSGWSFSASGLAAVWAEENTRDAILDAFERREVYATTGPRMRVRVFAGDFELDAAESDVAPEGAVAMGGELAHREAAPAFLIQAAKDPKSAHLDRVQMIKGWIADGATHEQVYDVAWSGDRAPDAAGRVPAVPDTVDLKTARYTNDHGAATLAAVWLDPDFDPNVRAFYYVRVLEVPTPRHSLFDAIALGIDRAETGQPPSIQERAYTSPIHYRP